MSLKKAYCPNCHFKNEKNHVFLVNEDALTCYCPRCLSEFHPKDVINKYDQILNKKISSAKILLYSAINMQLAYQKFADLIEFDSDCVDGYYGRLLALIYMSTLRHPRFDDFNLMFEVSNSMFRKSDLEQYVRFLDKCNNAIKEYDTNFVKRLSFKKYFYDIDCLKLYFKNLIEIKLTLKLLLKEVLYIKNNLKFSNVQLISLEQDLTENIDKNANKISDKYQTFEGYTYSFVEESKNGNILLGHSDSRKKTLLKHIKPKSLNSGDKHKKHIIKDKVYPDNTNVYKLMKITLPMFCVFITLMIVSLILLFILKNKITFYVFLISSISFAFISICFIVLHLISKMKLNKRHQLIK